MKKVLVSLLMIFLGINAMSQEKKVGYLGYSGGMMLHTGFVSGKSTNFLYPDGTIHQSTKMRGLPYGIGGAIKIKFAEHFRIGCEGYISTFTYGEYNSYSKTGWGGLLADYLFEKDKWTFFAGTTVGGGGVKNLTLFADLTLDFAIESLSVSFRRYNFIALAPFAGVEYALSEKIHAIIKMDYLFNLNCPQADFVTGPRLYIGIMFTHEKKQ